MNPSPDTKAKYPHIVVAGAGSIGCFVGGMLARAGQDVTLFLRPKLGQELLRQGLTLSDFTDLDEELSPDLFGVDTDPSCLSKADIVLVTVKSGDTQHMGHLIAQYASKDAVVVSLQNGVGNAGQLKEMLQTRDVRAGMVPFNVVNMGGGRFHRGTSGDIVIEKGPGHIGRYLSAPGLGVSERKSMVELQWGKLLVNLNNALNALSGLSLQEQLHSMAWRRLMADQIDEALRVLASAGIKPVPPMMPRLPMRFIPRILRMPSLLFPLVARSMLTIDPNARSSMWEDLENGRMTEIEELQGVIVELARAEGMKAPLNERVANLIREIEAHGEGSPGLFPKEIRY